MSWEPPFSTGTDRAEPTGLRRLLRLPAARRNLFVAAAVVVCVGILLFPRSGGSPSATTTYPYDNAVEEPSSTLSPLGGDVDTVLGTPAPANAPSPTVTSGAVAERAPGRAAYTIYLYKLAGIAPDSAPGTRLDIWVTWKPPVTERPKVNLLLEDVELGRIESGFEEGPVADLLVDEDDVPDLIYGERFGALTAVVRPPG